MKVLIGCEESQTVCKAFRARGHEAFSCDLKPCSGGHPEWHIQDDIMNVLHTNVKRDIIILHPDCTKMAVSGNRWYGSTTDKYCERVDAIEWTVRLWKLATDKADKCALENPVSVIFQYLSYGQLQYIQPWQFGHGETKKTGLYLFNLPNLKPTKIVDGREQRIWKMPPSEDRKRLRSITYQGIANAMAEQWC